MNMQKNNKKFLSACGIATLVVSTAVVPTTGVKAASTERLAGSDRYETAVEVSEEGWTSSDYVVLANGESYADALCAVPLAKAKDAPILLTETNSLNSETLAEMKRLNAKHVIIVGGDGVVTEGVQNAIKSQVTSDVERYGGADRFETSVKIAKALGSPSEVFVANGLNFPDALSAAPIAAIEGDPIILTRSTELPQVSADYIESNSNITKSYVVGGSGVISDSILNKLPNPERLGGADRYETNEAIVEAFESSLNFNKVFVARGDEFSDSLTGAALAAKEKSALVITATSGSVSPYTKELFEDLVDSGVTIEALGGSAVLPDSIISELESAITKSSTSGGGGGSSSSSSSSSEGINITKYVKIIDSYKSAVKAINSGDLKNSYFNIDDSDPDSINIQLLKSDTTLKDIFNDAEDRYETKNGSVDTDKIKADVKKVNDKLDVVYGSESLDTATINKANLQEIMKNSGSKYIDSSTGKLNAEAIADEIKSKIDSGDDSDYGFNDFKTELDDKISSYLDNHATKNDNTVEIKVEEYTISKIKKNGRILYSSEDKAEDVADALIDIMFEDTKINDNYKFVISTGDYIVVNVNKAN
jgi:N-acetylmuramoyl-L-alanine amidase